MWTYIGLLLLSGGLGVALSCGMTYGQCAAVVLLLFLITAKGEKKK